MAGVSAYEKVYKQWKNIQIPSSKSVCLSSRGSVRSEIDWEVKVGIQKKCS